MNTIEVTITPEDFANAFDYSATFGCPLYKAFRRSLPHLFVHMGIYDLTIDGIMYKIPDEWGEIENIKQWINDNPNSYSFPGKYKGELINDIIARAKISLEGIPTVHLTLTKIEN